ncbi:MAG: hypothetical protein EAX96_01270 [Candidatus Lokiarchaeota archaeon]|nr:hypothetical protein [Candidatus Lokiarchaeota archaeon]
MKIDKKISSLSELKAGLKKLFDKNRLKMLCLFSISGSTKGLPLVAISNEEFNEKIFVANLTEAINKINELDLKMNKKFNDIIINYNQDLLVCYPITDKIILASLGEKTKEIVKFCEKYSSFISKLAS